MKKHDLIKLGVPKACLDLALEYVIACVKSGLVRRYKPHELVSMVMDHPENYFNDSLAGRFAKALAVDAKMEMRAPATYKIWGENGIETGAIEQLRAACTLPISYRAALCADAHQGYGLPIGGVLATLGAVIPYAVGVDIACRMKLTVLDVEASRLKIDQDAFTKALLTQTIFGAGQEQPERTDHPVMDQDWDFCQITKNVKDLARSQLGTSGGGNHFVEFGEIEFGVIPPNSNVALGKKYVAILSHSGSRGPGSKICKFFNDIAKRATDGKYRFLPWLEMDTEAGQQYWQAMNLMGDFSAANHEIIHKRIVKCLKATSLFQVENHHNWAWKEIHDGCEVIVHRKGATPAGKGVLGVIPGSMADPAYLVEGLGNPASLNSASHGAGRKMSRSAASAKFDWEFWNAELRRRDVKLLGAGLDEVPGAYKNIDEVMAQQTDLVKVLARFDPRIVRMASDGPAED